MLGSKTSIRFLPLRLAMYIEMSALRSSSSAVWSREVSDRDAEAGMDEQLLATDRERGPQGIRQALGHDRRVRGRRWVLDQHGELVATHPGERVARAQAGPQALGDPFQDRVALAVAEAVVDRLEVVEVHEQHGQRSRRTVGQQERVLEAVDEQGAVGQSGQRVVERQMAELLLELPA